MKKTKRTLVLALMVLTAFSLSAQKPADLVGTWEGEGTLEGEADPNILSLVLVLKEGELSGHMTDQYGALIETPIEGVNLEEGTFGFSISTDMGGTLMTFKFIMKVNGDSMEGKIEVPDYGINGTWEATKQK